MKILFWFGVLMLGLGVISLFVPIPHTENNGFSAGGMSIGVQTRHSEKVSPIVSGALLIAGAGILIGGRSAFKS